MSVRYRLNLTVRYDYEQPARGGRHLLHVLPLSLFETQEVTNTVLEISPLPTERTEFMDFFGNLATEITLGERHTQLELVLECIVRRLVQPRVVDRSPKLADMAWDLFQVRELSTHSPHHFLGPSPRIGLDKDMEEYARAATAGAGSSLEAVLALSAALNRDIRFDPGATTVDTPPAEAFARRHGVCQDISHIMITMLRALGVPTAYVSGFLRTEPPAGQPRLAGADAMHAWVRVWLGGQMGWLGIDPTNNMIVGTDHVVVARGRDYSDVAPVRGVLTISGGQTTTHSVDLVPLEEGEHS